MTYQFEGCMAQIKAQPNESSKAVPFPELIAS